MLIGINCPICGTECVVRVFKDNYGVEGSPEWDEIEQEYGCDCEKEDEFFDRVIDAAHAKKEESRWGI